MRVIGPVEGRAVLVPFFVDGPVSRPDRLEPAPTRLPETVAGTDVRGVMPPRTVRIDELTRRKR